MTHEAQKFVLKKNILQLVLHLLAAIFCLVIAILLSPTGSQPSDPFSTLLAIVCFILAFYIPFFYFDHVPTVIISSKGIQWGKHWGATTFTWEQVLRVETNIKHPIRFMGLLKFPMEAIRFELHPNEEKVIYLDYYSKGGELVSLIKNRQEQHPPNFSLLTTSAELPRFSALRSEQFEAFRPHFFLNFYSAMMLFSGILIYIQIPQENAPMWLAPAAGLLWIAFFFFFGLFQHYPLLSTKYLVIRNNYWWWKADVFLLKNITELALELENGQSYLRIYQRTGAMRRYNISVMGKKQGLSFLKKIRPMGVKVRNELWQKQ